MDSKLWNAIQDNKWNANYLENLLTNREEKLKDQIERYNNGNKILKYQTNLCILRLCIKRDNLGVPIELWNIICEYLQNDIHALMMDSFLM